MRRKTVKLDIQPLENSYKPNLGPKRSPFRNESNFNLLMGENDKGVDKILRKLKIRSRLKTIDNLAF